MTIDCGCRVAGGLGVIFSHQTPSVFQHQRGRVSAVGVFYMQCPRNFKWDIHGVMDIIHGQEICFLRDTGRH